VKRRAPRYVVLDPEPWRNAGWDYRQQRGKRRRLARKISREMERNAR